MDELLLRRAQNGDPEAFGQLTGKPLRTAARRR